MADDESTPAGSGPAEQPRGAKDTDRADKPGAEQGQDGPLGEDSAIRSVQGESAQWRQDISRSKKVRDSKRNRKTVEWISAGTINVFNDRVDVGGDFTLGDRSSRTPRASSGPVPIDAEHIQDYLLGYVEPAAFATALDILQREHLLVIAASGGNGLQTTSLALLDRLVLADAETGAAPIFDLGTGVLGNNKWTVPAGGQGYLVVDTEPESFGHKAGYDLMDDAWLTRTRGQLCDAGSYLVVVIRQVNGKLAEATHRTDHVIENLLAARPADIVRAKVLAFNVELDQDQLNGWLADPDTVQMLAERPQPRFAARCATEILRAVDQGDDVPTVLSRLHDATELVREWFADHTDAGQIALAVATATLDESSYLTVSDAATALYKQITTRRGPSQALRHRLDLPANHSWIELAAPDDDPSGVGILRFRTLAVRIAVLRYAWTEFDGLRAELLDWLDEQAGHGDAEVRERAAQSAGLLAVGDFQHALHSYIVRWAGSDHWLLRSTAAAVLGYVGEAPQLTKRVWSLMRQWQTHPRSELRATAAMVAGGPLGVEEPYRALRVLHRLLDVDDDWDLLAPVTVSVLRLLLEVEPGIVLDALMDWSEPENTADHKVKALVIFSAVVCQPAVAIADDDDTGDGDREPLLLTRALDYREELPELWGRAFAHSAVTQYALSALHEWVRVADENDNRYRVVLDLVAGLADRSERDAERVEYYLEQWALDEDDALLAAKKMLAALLDAS